MVERVIEPVVEKCTGCKACELICTFEKDSEFNPRKSRIRVHLNEALCLAIPSLCMQCSNAPCVAACPTDALYRDPATGAILVEESECIGCRMCGPSCPFGAIQFRSGVDYPFKCDLCEGDPQCVKICQAGALRFIPKEETGMIQYRLHVGRVERELEKSTG